MSDLRTLVNTTAPGPAPFVLLHFYDFHDFRSHG